MPEKSVTLFAHTVGRHRIVLRGGPIAICGSIVLLATALLADESNGLTSDNPSSASLERLHEIGRKRSRFLGETPFNSRVTNNQAPEPKLVEFHAKIAPILKNHCFECHGPDTQEGKLRLDTLDPNLHHGKDIEWWTEVFSAVSKGEMPPADSKSLPDSDRASMVDWLSNELHTASMVRRQSISPSAFRRMTRYEFNYALQDLLDLSWDFAKELPPEAKSSEGFRNTAEQLGMSVTLLESYHRLARKALFRATVRGEKPPVVSWQVLMEDVSRLEWPKLDQQAEKLKKELQDDEAKFKRELEKLEQSFTRPRPQTYFRNLQTGRTVASHWDYQQAKYAIAPIANLREPPKSISQVAILPAGKWLNIELGNQLPEDGTLRVRVRACRVATDRDYLPSLQLHFGWQASNEGRALMRVSEQDRTVTAPLHAPEFYQFDVPLGEIYPRNSVRRSSPMGAMPNPSEYIRLVNSSASAGDIQVDYVEVQAPVYDAWPPHSHRNIFLSHDGKIDEPEDVRQVISGFMRRAWRREIAAKELDRKMDLFSQLRKDSGSYEEAVVETLATVLASPKFLYLTLPDEAPAEKSATNSPIRRRLSPSELATRLSMFLWCSIPDEELMEVASKGRLLEPSVLADQVQRMLSDARSKRLAEQFVHQWLDLELLDFLNFQQHVPHFDPLLKEAMQHEPIALFQEILRNNESVIHFLHADYTMANERLAQHYGIEGVQGNHFRRVALDSQSHRGGLLTQAGPLSMNSDYPDSHPLKRGKWILVSLLNDPPPPPPPAVPQIDLTNPAIAKMTLKERIEDHRNQPACYHCHLKIDPWGIAFENYDALGNWRDKIGDKSVNASSELSNHQKLNGMDGLKRYLLEHRQDQFVSAMVHKLTTFALGRTLKFADRADLDEITAEVRRKNDGLRSMITAIVASELFQTR